ncbi:patatin-like phospholipase family protein [Hymenobacter sp. BT635]|uniref:Patatin-like phospholipase family protein n=1 Tax=Hymenobacter nitidus TaxID=2880929 RepID=A0ABS8AG79_9BACT|nr:patatin-like phospholipase family protein [Hymenobacter nitidus]MCB2379436.1 patatin-like phospholipase family protein [Hymenobacter nitidus]
MRKLGLALSGGAARGIAHLGVLQALDELQLPIGHIAGVSSGAIAGAFYAAGFAPREIFRLLTDTRFVRLLRPSFRLGLVRLDLVEKLYQHYLGAAPTFEALTTPLTLVATDLAAGQTVYFQQGPLLKPLLGAAAVPIVCRPVEWQGQVLVDGGVMNNLPVEPLLAQANLAVVGVHCNPMSPEAPLTTLREVGERTAYLAISMNVQPRLAQCHFILEPPALHRFRVTDLRRAPEIFDIGYAHTMAQAAALRELLAEGSANGQD